MEEIKDRFEKTLLSALEQWSLSVKSEQLAQLCGHFQTLLSKNQSINLTRITDPIEAAIKHYADSLSLVVWARDSGVHVKSVLDIGAGAGFPSAPVAILCPSWKVTALDTRLRKVEFLTEVCASLGLENLTAFHGHTSHWQPAGLFDVVVTKALAKLPTALSSISHYAAPLGYVVLYKTKAVDPRERAEGLSVAAKLKLTPRETFTYTLNLGEEKIERNLLVFQKKKN